MPGLATRRRNGGRPSAVERSMRRLVPIASLLVACGATPPPPPEPVPHDAPEPVSFDDLPEGACGGLAELPTGEGID